MNHTLSDTELDRAARAYAFKHHVGYAEALQNTATIASGQSGSFSESATPGVPVSSEAKLHVAATRYAAENYVSYSQALECVRFSEESTSFSEGATSSGATLLARQPIEIFRSGVHVDNEGNKRSFTQADVQAMAACYSPQRHEAPLTLGHSGDNKPAYGWVKKLQATPDGRLLMMADQIDPAFAESVKAGSFKKRSASFYPPTHSNNPKPGSWYLRHVAWLGAQPPAVKGLADASFSVPSTDGAISFEM